MHELGVVMQVVDVVEKFARENQVEKIDAESWLGLCRVKAAWLP